MTILRVAPAASLNVTFPTTIRLVRAASAAGTTEVAVTVNEQPGPPAGHDPMSPVPTTNDEPLAFAAGDPDGLPPGLPVAVCVPVAPPSPVVVVVGVGGVVGPPPPACP